MKPQQIQEYIRESNAIENVHSEEAVKTSLEAWDYLSSQSTLNHETIKKGHELILQNRQPDIAGEYRTVSVHIGTDTPPAPSAVKPLMTQLLDKQPSSALEALKFHVEFEKIHPFQDGNGRIGRLIYLWHCLEKLNTQPIMWRENDVEGYYALFQTAKSPKPDVNENPR